MAVPKKRTSRTRKLQRRSHDALKTPQLTAGVPRRILRAVSLGLVVKDK